MPKKNDNAVAEPETAAEVTSEVTEQVAAPAEERRILITTVTDNEPEPVEAPQHDERTLAEIECGRKALEKYKRRSRAE